MSAKSQAQAAVLTGAMLSVEPRPLETFELRVQPVRRVVEHVAPPLDLSSVPFRYRGVSPMPPRHRRACRRRR